MLKEKYPQVGEVSIAEIIKDIKCEQDNSDDYNDKYGFLSDADVNVLRNLVQQS